MFSIFRENKNLTELFQNFEPLNRLIENRDEDQKNSRPDGHL